MKNAFLIYILSSALGGGTLIAALNIPSDGSDGALTITADTVIDLGQAVTGKWDANNAANAGNGVYDPEKWAVVFKYASVNVKADVTVTFKNHASRAPVVWLVQGDANIAGAVRLNGQNGLKPPELAEPGPGGFRGGAFYYSPGVGPGAGFGVGGGKLDVLGGSYGTVAFQASLSARYGNPSLLPLIGGSGGAGGGYQSVGGGAGGGAVLIACSGVLTISGSGQISCNGGSSLNVGSGGGSGGGIRLVASSLSGGGNVVALGGGGRTIFSDVYAGGSGRIRIEAVSKSSNLSVTPDPSVVTLLDDTTPQIWQPDSGPAVRIISIGGQATPDDPRAAFGALGADVALTQTTSTAVIVETKNVEKASVVTIRRTPRANGNFTETTATQDQVVSENPLVIRWKANVPINEGYSAMQVHVVRP